MEAQEGLNANDKKPAISGGRLVGAFGRIKARSDTLFNGAEHKLMLTVSDQEMSAASKGWLKLRLRTDRTVLCIALPAKEGVAGKTIFIDTGDAGAVSLSPEKWREWKAAHSFQPITLTSDYTPGAGLVVREQSWADELSLDGLILHDVFVQGSNLAQAAAAGPEYEATLGLAALSRLDLLIDGKLGVVYAHPRDEMAFPSQYNRLGAVFVPENDRSDALIAHVAAISPADIVGIRDGDQLLSIDQLDVTKWRSHPEIPPIGQYWEQDAGKAMILTLRRGQQVIKKPVMLKDMFGS